MNESFVKRFNFFYMFTNFLRCDNCLVSWRTTAKLQFRLQMHKRKQKLSKFREKHFRLSPDRPHVQSFASRIVAKPCQKQNAQKRKQKLNEISENCSKISEKHLSLSPDRPHAEACAQVRRSTSTAKLRQKWKIGHKSIKIYVWFDHCTLHMPWTW